MECFAFTGNKLMGRLGKQKVHVLAVASHILAQIPCFVANVFYTWNSCILKND